MKRIRNDASLAQPTVAFYAHKGGVGKTTACLATAVMAAQKGLRVMLLDCDPQQNATAFLAQWQGEPRFDYDGDYRAMVRHYRAQQSRNPTDEEKLVMKEYALEHRNLFDLLLMDSRDGFTPKLEKMPELGYAVTDYLSVMAAHPMLTAFDTVLAFEVAHRQFEPNHMARLGWLLKHLGTRFDVVLLDLSPSNSLFNQMALASCGYFVMPLTGDRFALQSLDTLDLMLELVRDNFASRLDPVPEPRLPQLLCLLYNQYKTGDALLKMERVAYDVSQDDATRCDEITALLRREAKTLGAFMDVERVCRQVVLVQESDELYKKLGHAYYTVFDAPHRTVTPLELWRLAQRQDYDILWMRLATLLFPTRVEWR